MALIDWETAIIFDDGRRDYGERRQVCLGRLRDHLVVVAYTFRGHASRDLHEKGEQTGKEDP